MIYIYTYTYVYVDIYIYMVNPIMYDYEMNISVPHA